MTNTDQITPQLITVGNVVKSLLNSTTQAKFPLGHVVITANAAQHLDTVAVNDALRRHVTGDWGDLCPEDACANTCALTRGGRLFSAYGNGERRFWIITEADRSATTILMPEDY
ncbi:MAG TPA: hypothetical protein VFE62_02855 [Gemmataceae bacterium]|nr:hypothetical protein [Gemmataceae bacterium]